MSAMDRYDENLSENKFLTCLKNDYELVFEEAVSCNCIICIPKSNIINEISINIIFDHILSPSEEDGNEVYITRMNKTLILKEGCFFSKTEDKYVNVLFEETFYDRNLGKYKVVCIDNYITHLFQSQFTKMETEEKLKNWRPGHILRNLRSVKDFSEAIYLATQSYSTIDQIDAAIAEFLSIPLLTFDYPNIEHLRAKVQELFDIAVKDFVKPINESDSSILLISMESYIIHNISKILFEASTLSMAQEDEKLNRVLHGIKDISASSFEIKISNSKWLLSARYELAAINSYKSPFGKLQCVRRTIDCFETDHILCSDELLPILLFCIVKCNLSNWFANLSFIKTFHFSLKMNNEYDYILSSLEAALQYLQSGELNKLHSQNLKMELLKDCNLANVEASSSLQKGRNEILSSLHTKIINDNLDAVQALLEMEKSSETFSPLLGLESQFCHPLCGCVKCKSLLHESYYQLLPCDINSVDENNMSLLHIAAKHGSINVADYLIKKGASLNGCSSTGMIPLHFAAYKGHQNVLLLLLHSGCDISSTDNEGNTALHLACIAGHDKCVKALIFFAESIGLPVGYNSQNLSGDTALHLASRWGYSTLVKFLLSQSTVLIGLTIRNKRNQIPLDCAHNSAISSLLRESALCAENHEDVNLLLLNFEHCNLEERNDISKSNSNDNETHQHIQKLNTSIENEKILRKIFNAIHVHDIKLACFYLEINDEDTPCRPIDIEHSDNQCHPLCQCSNCSYISHKSVLKCNKSLVNMVGENYGVLHTAILVRKLEFCQILLSHGADPLLTTRVEKQSCIHLAIKVEHYEIMELLIKHCADINAVDIFGNTPLHCACICGWKEGVCLLINSGAEIDKNNKNELSPKEEAYQNCHMEIVQILAMKMSN